MDSCSHDNVDAPIVLDDDELNTGFCATSSAAGDNRTFGASPNFHAMPIAMIVTTLFLMFLPITNDLAQDLATDSTNGSSQSLSNRNVKPNGFDGMDQLRSSSYQQQGQHLSSPTDETAEGPSKTPYRKHQLRSVIFVMFLLSTRGYSTQTRWYGLEKQDHYAETWDK